MSAPARTKTISVVDRSVHRRARGGSARAPIVANVLDDQGDRGEQPEHAGPEPPAAGDVRPPVRAQVDARQRRSPPRAPARRTRAPPLVTSRSRRVSTTAAATHAVAYAACPLGIRGARRVHQRAGGPRPVDRVLGHVHGDVDEREARAPARAPRRSAARDDEHDARAPPRARCTVGSAPRSVTTFATSTSMSLRMPVGQVEQVAVERRRARGRRTKMRDVERRTRTRPRRPRPASVVSSSPSSPGVSRFQTKRSSAAEDPHDRADDPAVQRARRSRTAACTSGWLAVREQPGAGSRRGAGTPSPRRRSRATVTPKPNSACPAMCCDLVERAPEDVAEHAEERRPERRVPTMLYGMKRR